MYSHTSVVTFEPSIEDTGAKNESIGPAPSNNLGNNIFSPLPSELSEDEDGFDLVREDSFGSDMEYHSNTPTT